MDKKHSRRDCCTCEAIDEMPDQFRVYNCKSRSQIKLWIISALDKQIQFGVSQGSMLKTILWPIMFYFYKLLFGWRVVSLALISHLPIISNHKPIAVQCNLWECNPSINLNNRKLYHSYPWYNFHNYTMVLLFRNSKEKNVKTWPRPPEFFDRNNKVSVGPLS